MSSTSFIITLVHKVRNTVSEAVTEFSLERLCFYSVRKWLGAQILSLLCFSHPELLIVLSLLLAGEFCSPGTLRGKKEEVIQEVGQINELATPTGQRERRIWGSECAYGYG